MISKSAVRSTGYMRASDTFFSRNRLSFVISSEPVRTYVSIKRALVGKRGRERQRERRDKRKKEREKKKRRRETGGVPNKFRRRWDLERPDSRT